jgi:hypothetical protein
MGSGALDCYCSKAAPCHLANTHAVTPGATTRPCCLL